jgi:eukaryotic-like serine/threonine-protein kinase
MSAERRVRRGSGDGARPPEPPSVPEDPAGAFDGGDARVCSPVLEVVGALNRYEVFDAIARGGAASVHLGRARWADGFRVVAVKRLHPSHVIDPEAVAAFMDEARLVACIDHPNVVRVLDVAFADEEPFLIMDYVEGEPLSALAFTSGDVVRVPLAIATRVFVDVLEGLHAAHQTRDEAGRLLGLVHRDVSPDNVLVGVDGVARLLDFGIAKAIGRRQVTRDRALKGKVPYMAPEQLRGEAVTHLADVYSASVALWEALTGRRTFSGGSEADVAVRVLTASVASPSVFAPEIGADVDRIVMRGLARDKRARYASALAMAVELEAVAPPASRAAVGAWVDARAGRAIAERARTVARLEEPAAAERDDDP